MRRWAVVLSALTVALGAATTVAGTAANAGNDNDPYTLSDGHAQAGPAGGIVPARDASGNARPRGGGSSPNLIYNGGPVQHSNNVLAIYWGMSWSTAAPDAKEDGLGTLYQGLSNSHYAATNQEYSDRGGNVSANANYAGYIVDHSPAPTGAPSTSTIANEVLHALSISGNTLQGNWYYPVYIDQPRGNTGYCAWHSAATTTSTHTEFQFGFFFNLDGDAGCDPRDTFTGHAQGLAALGNVTGHEYSEMVTDPQLNAWLDQQGNENADKCAWHFNGTELLGNSTTWYIQGNWSNAASNAGTGYYNRGCITSA